MGASSGIAGLKSLQWLLRGIQLVLSVGILGINSYFLATLAKGSIDVPTSVKAAEGISAIGTVFALLGVLLVCCCAGHPGTSFIAMVIDGGLAGGYVYVAVANRDGAASCSSGTVETVYGSGDANSTPSGGHGSGILGSFGLPTFMTACRLEMVVLIAACADVLFLLLSILLEVKMNRNRYRASRPLRDPDGEYITKSDHLRPGFGPGAPSAASPPQRRDGKHYKPLLGAFRGRDRGLAVAGRGPLMNPDALPGHQQPSDMQTRQVADWGEVTSLHDSDRLYFNEGADRDEHGPPEPPVRFNPTTAPRPAAESYEDGDLGTREFERARDAQTEEQANAPVNLGRRRETREARLERLANY